MAWYQKAFAWYLGEHVPPPPELPKYDKNEEPPKWNWTRMSYNLPVERDQPWTEIGTQPDSPDKPDWRGVIRNKVIEYEMPEEYKFGQHQDKRYFWFDTPDYADPFKKLGYGLKFFFATGGAFACVVAMNRGYNVTLANNMKLMKEFVFPWMAAGMAGSLTVLCLANLRNKKDDVYNYVAAGFVMSSILGRKNHVKWFQWTMVLPAAAATVKYNAETNGILIPKWNPRIATYGLTGFDAEHGIASGDLRFGMRFRNPDPGRDVRTPY